MGQRDDGAGKEGLSVEVVEVDEMNTDMPNDMRLQQAAGYLDFFADGRSVDSRCSF